MAISMGGSKSYICDLRHLIGTTEIEVGFLFSKNKEYP
jgi:hypothetical protein